MNKIRLMIAGATLALVCGGCSPLARSDQSPVEPAQNASERTAVVLAPPAANVTTGDKTSVPEPTSMDYVREGTVAYVAHDFVRAIPFYQRALELEKKDRKLDKKIWLVLVDNLAMAHGMAGDIKNSQSVLQYGISKEPTYPMFYYNMACDYGEAGDEDNAIKYLRMATKYRANMIQGETFPDPATDTSFRKFSDSDKFKKALAELNQR